MDNYNTEEEVWKDVKGYEGYYMISSLGRVKSMPRKENKRVPGERIRKTKKNLGYEVVNLSKKGVVKTVKIHRMVAEAFIENNSNYPEVNHIDGKKGNNNLGNLEWVTSRENALHASREGLQSNSSKKRGILKLSVSGEVLNEYTSVSDAIRDLGVSHSCSNIYRACRGVQKTAYGYKWEYA